MCWCNCSQPVEILDLLDGMLTLDTEKRMNANAALELSWLRKAVIMFQPANWSVAFSVQCLIVGLIMGTGVTWVARWSSG